MPKRKSTERPTRQKSVRSKTSAPSSQSKSPKRQALRPAARGEKALPPPLNNGAPSNYSEEYLEYLERYELYGEDRPRLSPPEFEQLDEEMLDLLALETEQGLLNDDQIVRLQELEYLLLDSEQ